MLFRVAFPICLIALLVLPARAQPWDMPPARPLSADSGHAFTEVGVGAAKLWDTAALSLELRIGRELPSGVSWSSGVHLLATPAPPGDAGGRPRRLNTLVHVGPSVGYARRLAGPVRGYAGATLGVGVAGFEEQRQGRRVHGSGAFVGARPMAGFLLRTERFPHVEALQIRAGASVLVGRFLRAGRFARDSDRALFGGPAVAVSVRAVR